STGLFGPVGEPAVMGRHQAGILTPVTWNGAPAHLVWNVVSVRGRPVGAYLFIFRRRSRSGFRSIRTSQDQEAVRLGGSHLPLLVPLSPRFRPDRVILPRSRGIPPDLPTWGRLLRKVDTGELHATREPAVSTLRPGPQGGPSDNVPAGIDGLPLDQVFRAGGRRFFRACLHPDRPWEIWMVSPRSGDSFLEEHRQGLGAGLLFAGTWLSLGLTVLVRGRPWRVPMRVSFSGLFMLLGGLPLGIFLALGLLRIETSLDSDLRRMREEGAAALSRLDRLGGQALRDFRAAGHALLDRRAVRETLLGEDPRGWAAVASFAFRLYPAFHSRLDRMAIFPVRSVGRDFLRRGAGRGEGVMAQAGIAAATKGVHDIYWLTASDSYHEFQLSSLQKDMEATMRSGFSQVSSIFLACKQRGEMWQMSPRERFFRSTDLLGADHRPTRYLYLRVDASPLLESLLRQGAHRLALAHPADRFLVAQQVPGGVRPLVPHAASGFWRTRSGRRWLARFSEAGVAGGEPEGRDPDRVWLIRRADRSGAFLFGGEFALGPLLERHAQARTGLWAAFAALLLLIGRVG
ncbi:MAG: hypothetical protein GX442_06320, partial [Candidatus Riflebacteria bacterium]|nr:hypothetical protein [Candidatus Riflebacteria bacterium]